MTIPHFDSARVVAKMFNVMDGVADGTMSVKSAAEIRSAAAVAVRTQETEIRKALATPLPRQVVGVDRPLRNRSPYTDKDSTAEFDHHSAGR